MCNINDMAYCQYCQQYYRNDYVHTCSGTSWYCNGCGQYVYGNHACSGTANYGYHFAPFDEPFKHYKCPRCKGEFSEPSSKWGKRKNGNYAQLYGCPFCGRELKGLNQ